MNRELADKINFHLRSLSKRPGMYVGDCSYKSITIHLDGYFQAIMEICEVSLPMGWQRWIEMKYGICSPAWNWSRIIYHSAKSEEEAIKLLPALVEEFINTMIDVGIEGIEIEHQSYVFNSTP